MSVCEQSGYLAQLTRMDRWMRVDHMSQLIDAAVRTRVPPDASPEAVAAIRAEVEALLGENPLIQQWLRP